MSWDLRHFNQYISSLWPKRGAGCNSAAQPYSGEQDQDHVLASLGTPERARGPAAVVHTSQPMLSCYAWAAQIGWQENPSWFRAMHLAGCSNAWGGARVQEGRESTSHASCKAIARSPHNSPLC